MTKKELADMLAARAQLSRAAAADELDRLVARILKELRKGQPVSLPGIGILAPGGKRGIQLLPAPRAAKNAAPTTSAVSRLKRK